VTSEECPGVEGQTVVVVVVVVGCPAPVAVGSVAVVYTRFLFPKVRFADIYLPSRYS